MTHRDQVAEGLADAILAGTPGTGSYAARCAQALGGQQPWLRPFARRVLRRFGAELGLAQRRELVEFILGDPGYVEAWSAPEKPCIRRFFFPAPVMAPRRGALAACALPELATPGELAAWLGLGVSELEWYADRHGMIHEPEGALSHYRYRWIPKRHGDYRLIESPKPTLRAIQRKILHGILDAVPPHEAAHGFRRGRSCLSHAAPHVGRRVVLRMDLRDFFGSMPAGRVHALYRTLGYPQETARYLAALCANRVPPGKVLQGPGEGFSLSWQQRKKLGEPHLPQGAPTSPALANLCALRLDFRLAGLARSMGAAYTRYADDLAFSGDEPLRRRAERFGDEVAAIALDEGFEVNFRKTRIMHRSDRQVLTGIVVNEKTNLHRREFDRLKATLHNCLRLGPASQNHEGHPDFRAHLLGRVNHLKRLNPPRGERLQALLERIEWPA
jgi:hypothetical protein